MMESLCYRSHLSLRYRSRLVVHPCVWQVYDSLCGPLDSPPSSPTPQQRQQPPHSAAAVNQDHPPAPDQHSTSPDGEPRLPTPPEMW